MPKERLPKLCNPCKTKKNDEEEDAKPEFCSAIGISSLKKKVSFGASSVTSSIESLPPIKKVPKKKPNLGSWDRAQIDAKRILNSWAYRIPGHERLIYGGHLSPKFFNEICYGWRRIPGDEDFNYKRLYMVKREQPLWVPKKPASLACRRVERAIVEARDRQRKLLNNISEQADKYTKRQNAVLTRKAAAIDSRITSYLRNVERRYNVHPPRLRTPGKCGANVDILQKNHQSEPAYVHGSPSSSSGESCENICLESSEFDFQRQD